MTNDTTRSTWPGSTFWIECEWILQRNDDDDDQEYVGNGLNAIRGRKEWNQVQIHRTVAASSVCVCVCACWFLCVMRCEESVCVERGKWEYRVPLRLDEANGEVLPDRTLDNKLCWAQWDIFFEAGIWIIEIIDVYKILFNNRHFIYK